MLTDSGSNHITHDIIGCAITVHKALGPGLLESAYAACLAFELTEVALSRLKPVPRLPQHHASRVLQSRHAGRWSGGR